MATSGVLLIAKNKEVHQHLQAQFKNRMIKKRYIALLDGKISSKEGTIILPLRMDPLDRPRQVVDHEHGKTAITQYQVLNEQEGNTLIAFYPLTGRTHQLRVHAAHPEGLHCPIRGDELYGQKADRLYLHAESLEFVHPGDRLHNICFCGTYRGSMATKNVYTANRRLGPFDRQKPTKCKALTNESLTSNSGPLCDYHIHDVTKFQR